VENRVIDQYTLELEALGEDESKPLPVRCVATNTDDKTAAEAWLTLDHARTLLGYVCGNDETHVDHWMQQLEDHHYADLIARPGVRCVLNSAELVRLGFNHEELRPWRLEKAS
jgi:hypothetical protein